MYCVYFKDNDIRNVSKRFHSNQKNNNTELKAILEAIKQCIGVNKKNQYIQIHIILLILILNGHVNGLKIIGK